LVNADRNPGTLTLELILLNTENGAPVSMSLGSEPVTSHPNFSQDAVKPVRETLTFPVPAHSFMDQFTELKIVFHRSRLRMDKSAKVSVERFILQPR
jgi:hypothetical protein